MKFLIGKDYPAQVIPMIKNARMTIDIVMYDWRWYGDKPGHTMQQLNNALVQASKNGVRVRAVVNTGAHAKFLATLGIKARSLKDRRTLHSKLIIIDGEKLVIGSHNLTSNAFYRNLESSVILDLPKEPTRISEYFENLYNI